MKEYLEPLVFIVIGFCVLLHGIPVNAAWHTEIADEDGTVGVNTSLALDSNNNPYISYAGINQLKFAYYNGIWHTEVVDSSDYTGQSISLAVDSDNNPHISYVDGINSSLKYTWCDMELHSTWYKEVVDGGGVRDHQVTSLAVDSNDNPHIIYSYTMWPDNYYMIYTWCSWEYGMPCIWQTELLNDDGMISSLALDLNDNPHIIYSDMDGLLYYSYYDGIWHSELVGTGGADSLAIDSNGHPHISYSDYGGYQNTNLAYAHHDDSWHIEIVDSVGYNVHAPFSSSLALDSENNPHISYYDKTNGDLKYAYYNEEWHIQIVDSDGDVGQYNSLILDSEDNPHISYYDSTNGDLKYAYNLDKDDDGINNSEDNCPNNYNPGQEDSYPPGGNGCGDACECHADCNVDQKVNLADLVIMKQQFMWNCSQQPSCEADCNYDNTVDLSDLVMMKEEFLRSDCPMCQ